MGKPDKTQFNDELKKIISDTISSQLEPIINKSTELENTIEEMKQSINKDLKFNYLNSVAKLLEKDVHGLIDSFKCGYHPQTESQCKTWVKQHASMYAGMLETGDISQAFNILEEFLKVAEKNITDIDKNSRCHNDWIHIRNTLKRHHEFAKDIGSLFMSTPMNTNLKDLEFDPDTVYDDFVLPLSHPLRIKILHSLMNSSKRFTTLKTELDVKNTGLLVHHLKPLSECELVTQTFKKEYMLTEKGISIIKFLTQINQSITPSKPVPIQIKPLVKEEDERPKITTLNVIND
jgi:DNA-binding HxlR family transcriptional regulator